MSDKDEREENQNVQSKDADLAKKGGEPGPSGYGGMGDQDKEQSGNKDEQAPK